MLLDDPYVLLVPEDDPFLALGRPLTAGDLRDRDLVAKDCGTPSQRDLDARSDAPRHRDAHRRARQRRRDRARPGGERRRHRRHVAPARLRRARRHARPVARGDAAAAAHRPARRRGGTGRPAHGARRERCFRPPEPASLVRERLQHVEPARAPRRQDRRQHAGRDRDDHEGGERLAGDAEGHVVLGQRRGSRAPPARCRAAGRARRR